MIGALTRRRAEISDAVTARVDDPAVAALLIAKVSLAAERGDRPRARRRRRAPPARPRAVRRRRHRARQPGRQRGRRRGRRGRRPGRRPPRAIDDDGRAGPGRRHRARRARGAPRRSSAAATPPSPATRAAAASGWRWCSWSASGAGARCRCHNDDGAVFTARLPRRRGRSAMTAIDLTVLVVDDDFMVASIHTRFVDRHRGLPGRRHGRDRRGRPDRDRRGWRPTSCCSTCTCPT